MGQKPSNKIIGGMFGLESANVKERKPLPFLMEDSLYLINARSCILLIIESLSPERIWLPSYLCGDILQSIKDPNQINYYGVDPDLLIKEHSWIDNLSEKDLVLVINYFGFKPDQVVLQAIKDKKAWILEDACQSLLTAGLGQYSDFVIFSPRKFIGVPDGGILGMRSDQMIVVDQLSDPPEEWWSRSLEASLSRRDFDAYGGSRDWFKVFQEVEKESPVGAYKMSDLSGKILRSGIDYGDVAAIRRRNYLFLLDSIGEFALYKNLPKDVIPLGFPICLSNRDQVKEIFYKQDIFPPIHWNIKGIVPPMFKDSHRLSSMILTLICDQRYDLNQMQRMVDVIRTYAER